MLLLILSTWKHNHTFADIKLWANTRNISYNILVGGCKFSHMKHDVLCVNATDDYEHLTQKMSEGLHFLFKHDVSWTHIMKIDDMDTDINGYARFGNFKLLEHDLGKTPYPYFGRKIYSYNTCHDHNSTCRYYHLNHVNELKNWLTKKYEGPFTSTAAGGQGYIVKRDLVQHLQLDVSSGSYEDVAMANYAKTLGFKPRPVKLFICNKTMN